MPNKKAGAFLTPSLQPAFFFTPSLQPICVPIFPARHKVCHLQSYSHPAMIVTTLQSFAHSCPCVLPILAPCTAHAYRPCLTDRWKLGGFRRRTMHRFSRRTRRSPRGLHAPRCALWQFLSVSPCRPCIPHHASVCVCGCSSMAKGEGAKGK